MACNVDFSKPVPQQCFDILDALQKHNSKLGCMITAEVLETPAGGVVLVTVSRLPSFKAQSCVTNCDEFLQMVRVVSLLQG